MLAAAPVLAQSAAAPAAQPMADINQAQAAGLAARRDFAQFVQHNLRTRQAGLPDGFPLDINDIQDLQDASVGYGFQVYTLDPQDIVAGRAALHSMVKPTGVWRFIIRLHDRPIGLATVEQSAGAWTTVAYGGAVLSKDVDALMAFHGNAQRSNLRFVRVFQAQSDFLEVQSGADAKVRFAPLHSARESLLLQQRAQKTNGAGADGLLDAADILEPLRAAVKTNMDAFR
ncbi:hypothetical protein [Janthinobacterium fluminis]|nr:hypothetical protein [Janthinobacterium fluminis]